MNILVVSVNEQQRGLLYNKMPGIPNKIQLRSYVKYPDTSLVNNQSAYICGSAVHESRRLLSSVKFNKTKHQNSYKAKLTPREGAYSFVAYHSRMDIDHESFARGERTRDSVQFTTQSPLQGHRSNTCHDYFLSPSKHHPTFITLDHAITH